MEFLLTFRLQDSFKKVQITKKTVVGLDVTHNSIYSCFVLLSHRTAWTILQYMGIICRYMITTFTISFLDTETFGLYDIFNILIDLFYFIDCVSAFLLWMVWSNKNKTFSVKTSPLAIILWKNKTYKPRPIYLLALDFISLLPLEYLRYMMEHQDWSHAVIHCLPLLRIYRLFFVYVDTGFKSSLSSSIWEVLAKFLLVAIIFTHTMTCICYMVQDPDQNTSLYVAQDDIHFDSQNPLEWYLITFYFVQITFTNVGFGDITPKNDVERMLSIFIALTGFLVINGYFIGALSSVLLEQARRLANLRLRLSLIQSELDRRKVPVTVHKKIMRFYYALWVTRKGAGTKVAMLKALPPAMTAQVCFDIFSCALDSSLLFRSCDEYSKRAISRVMSVHLYMAGDVILKRSQMNSKMFYIRKGTIQIMSYQDDETEIMTFGAGTVFGQCSLLLTLPSRSEVHAATFCEIHTLNRKKLFQTLVDYPNAKEIIVNVHKNLVLNMLADKYETKEINKEASIKPNNILNINSFYKEPLETSKLGRDDVCIITTFPYVFMPDTIFLKAWNILQGIIIVIISFYYPYCAAFLRKYPANMEHLILLMDLSYYLDIYLTLFTAINKENVLLSTGRQIAKERLSHLWIYLDIFAALPLHYFIPNEDRDKPVVLCIRCIKLYKLPLLFAKAEYTLNRTIIGIIRLIKYLLYAVLGCYAMATAYYMQACYTTECNPTSWYVHLPVDELGESPIYVSLYFAVMVISSVGYGDVSVNNAADMIWVTSFLFPAVLLSCYLISEYSAHLSLGRETRSNFIELAERVNSFLTNNKMLPSEKIRVRQYLNLQWEKNMGYEFIYDHDLFFDTPPHLYNEIKLQSRSKGIRDLELFRGLGENVFSSILKSCYRITLPPHEVVIYAGEVRSTLLILEEGYCEITYGRDVSIKRIIGPGENISTVELFLGLTAMYHVRTLTHCILLKVLKNDIYRSFVFNPIVSRELNMVIHDFKQSPIAKNFRSVRPIRLHLSVKPPLQQSILRFRYYHKQSGNSQLRDPYLKLGICQCIRFFLRNSTVLPYGKLLKRWEIVRCLFGFSSAILFPCLPYIELEVPALYYIGWFLDVMAWIDLYFRLHVCYYNNRNILVSHPLWTCGHYIKGSFALDFLFCFPFDRIMYRRVYDSNGETNASETPIDILRLLRVGQVHRIPATLMRLGVDFLSTPSLLLIIIMYSGFTMVFINLITSLLVLNSCNYKVTSAGNYRIYFKDERIMNHMMKFLEKFSFSTQPTQVYLLNFYWTGTTSFSIGFGDITATTKELMIFVIIVILLAYLFFNYMTIVIASFLSSINLNLTLYQKRLNYLIKFLKSENIDPLLKQHIINHFEYVWKKSRGMEGDVVFANFNLALKNDVMLYLYEETLRGVKAFKDFDPSFFRILSSRLKEIYFQSGACVYKRGDIVAHVYIIHQGEITLVGKLEDQTALLGRSAIFGHLEASEKGITSISAVATKNLHILQIPTTELYQLMENVYTKIKDETDESFYRQQMTILSVPSEEGEDDFEIYKIKTDVLGSKRIWFLQTSYKFSKCIHIMYLITAFMSVNLVSYHLAFQMHHLYILALSIPIEFLYLLKIYMGFNTGYIDDTGEFVTDIKAIRARYLRLTGFYRDFFTLIPFELFALFAQPKDRIFVATALRMTKILRVYEIWFFFNSKADTLNVNMLLLQLVSVGIVAALIYHQFTCIWFMIICPRAECPDSVTYNKITKDGNCNYIYLCCLYFVNVVLTTTGHGDLTPITVSEILYVLFLAFIARIYGAVFSGQMVSTVQKSLYAKTKYAFETETLKGYLIANDVSPPVKKTVLNYLNDLWKSEKGYQIPELLINAPKYLISEIKLAAYGSHINDNPIFRICGRGFRKQLIDKLKRTVYFPGNIIVHEGEVNGTAYFIHSGQVAFKLNQNAKGAQIKIVRDFFGLTQGMHRRLPHFYTYFARSSCIILTLSIEDWAYLIDFYPYDVAQLYKEIDKLEERKDSI